MEFPPRDLRAAVRALSRKPGVTALALASLALAIGFSTAAFSVLDAWSLRDLPVRAPAELVWIYANTREHRPDNFTWLEYQALAARSRMVPTIVAQGRQRYRVRLPGRDDLPILSAVSDNYFDGLGPNTIMGDVFHAGRGEDATVVLSHRYWQRALGGDPTVIGRILDVKATPLRVIGVLAPGFTGGVRGIAVDLFVPAQTFFGALRGANPNDRAFRDFELIGRLRPGVSPEHARAELDPILRQVDRDGLSAGPDRTSGIEAFAGKGLRSKLEGNAVFLAAIVLLILIAAANLANLRLVDNESHRRETGIRLALGAGRMALARQHLAETLLLTVAGAAAGWLLAAWLIRATEALLYAGKDYMDYGIVLDDRSLGFTVAALLAVVITGGLIPLGDAWKRRISPVLQGTRVTRPSRWLGALVVIQMALVTAATCSAGLLWRSLENIAAIRPAMDPDRLMLLVRGAWPGLSDDAAAARVPDLAMRIAGLPGVRQVAWARRALLSGSGGGAIVSVELPGQPKLSFRYNQVSANYFASTGARVLSGRVFAEADGPDSTPVAMVNAAFAQRFLDGRPASGQWVRIGGKDRQIVGIVEDGPTIHLRETIEPYLYFPFAQMPLNGPTFFIETQTDPAALAAAVRSLLRTADGTFAISDMFSFGEHMRGARAGEQLAAEVTGGLAAVGLLLAAAGLFGVSLYAVARRTPEFGVRIAMGATPARLASQVLREAALRVALALPLGWALSLAARRALEKLLYGVAPNDPITFLEAGLLVALVAFAAALHPAIQASQTDPIKALRA